MFKIGDAVIVARDSRVFYNYTKINSKGIVKKIIDDSRVSVEFYYVQGDNTVSSSYKPILTIFIEDLELTESYKRDMKKIYQELKKPYK